MPNSGMVFPVEMSFKSRLRSGRRNVSRSRVGATFLPQDKIGLDSDFLALSLQIRTISKERIVKRVSSLPRSYMSQIKESLKAVLDLDS